MHTIELLEEATEALKRLGYGVRIEALDGGAGGLCELKGRKWLFLDISQSPVEKLHEVLEVLRNDVYTQRLQLSEPLRRLIAGGRQAA